MEHGLTALFEAVRTACSAGKWSRGVELVRGGRVVALDSDDDDVLVCRVSERGGMISPTVTLFLDGAEWECQCPSPEVACEHAAAAVIALRRAEEQGTGLKTAEEAGHIEYRFERGTGGLALCRVVVRGREVVPVETSLATLLARPDAPGFVAGQPDLSAELALGTHRRGLLARGLVPKVFRALARSQSATLDGRPVRVDPEPLLPVVRVEEQGDGLRLVLAETAEVHERFQNGIARCGEALRPVGEPRLNAREAEELGRGRYFAPDEVGELVTDLLPDLRRRLPVEVHTERLPSAERLPPWIRLEVLRDDDRLRVLPTLVYGDPPTARVDGGRLVHLHGAVPLRDKVAETQLLGRLQRQLGLLPGVREEFVGEQAVALRSKLGAWKGWVRGQGLDYFRLAAPLVAAVQVEGARFDVRFTSGGADGAAGEAGNPARSAEPGAVLRAWRAGESLVPLLGGGWAPIPADWLERHGHRIADLLEARDARGELPRSAARDLVALCESLEHPVPAELGALRRVLEDFSEIPEAPLPADLTVTLRPYQRRGVDWLVFLRDLGLGALLADDMGLGKTLQALCALRGRALVVAPTSVVHNWVDEVRRHRPGLRCSVYHGPRRKLDPEADITVTSYALLRQDADTLAAQRWDTVVLDEAQAIKNPESQVAEAAFRLDAAFRLTLTGTPVENRLEELWSQFHFLNRGLLGGRQAFQERYAGPIAGGEPGAAERLRGRVRPFVLRRMKRDVAPELPPRTEVVLHCELDERERDVYDTIRAATLSEVVARLEAGGSVLAALEALLRLRQAACHVGLVPGHEADSSSKLAVLLESLENVVAEGHKALVFSQWTSLLDLAEPLLRRAAIPFTRLDGSTRDRAAVVAGFQAAEGPPVLLISLKAGGSGLNLTAADHVFLLDPWWNPAVEDQAADRAHRIGQDRPVMIYRLVAEETVEERILELQQAKRAIADAALGDADRAASLGRDDLLALLR